MSLPVMKSVCSSGHTVSVYDSAAPSCLLSAVAQLYQIAPGAERLLCRAANAAEDIAAGRADVAVSLDPMGVITAAALLYHHTPELAEIGSVVVTEHGKGVYSHLRQILAHRGNAMGKTVTLFERIPNDDPVKLDYERAKRMAEGWGLMNWEHPDFMAVERLKMHMPLSNGGKPPKLGFRMAVKPGADEPFVYKEIGPWECFRFRDPQYSLGR